jgi:hypothetical protein
MDVPNQLKEGAETIRNSIPTSINDATQSVADTFDEFADKAKVESAGLFGQQESSTTPGFLETNGLVAKFVFVFFVTIVFIILFQIAMRIVGRVYAPPRDVLLIDGMVSGNAQIKIRQNTSTSANTPIYRSDNEATGIEFTWGVWIFAEPNISESEPGTFQHIFSKGDTTSTSLDGILEPNNAPGLYIRTDADGSTLRVYMDDATPKLSFVDIRNIPLKKWVHVAILMKNMDLDVYVNGAIAARKKMAAVPKQNYGNVLVGYTQFKGNISNLAYYDSAVDVLSLSNTVQRGPGTKMASTTISNVTDYLSRIWYTSQ